jgi:hypothetical protein
VVVIPTGAHSLRERAPVGMTAPDMTAAPPAYRYEIAKTNRISLSPTGETIKPTGLSLSPTGETIKPTRLSLSPVGGSIKTNQMALPPKTAPPSNTLFTKKYSERFGF